MHVFWASINMAAGWWALVGRPQPRDEPQAATS